MNNNTLVSHRKWVYDEMVSRLISNVIGILSLAVIPIAVCGDEAGRVQKVTFPLILLSLPAVFCLLDIRNIFNKITITERGIECEYYPFLKKKKRFGAAFSNIEGIIVHHTTRATNTKLILKNDEILSLKGLGSKRFGILLDKAFKDLGLNYLMNSSATHHDFVLK